MQPRAPMTPGCLSQMWRGGRKTCNKGWGLVIASLDSTLNKYISTRRGVYSVVVCSIQRTRLEENSPYIPARSVHSSDLGACLFAKCNEIQVPGG